MPTYTDGTLAPQITADCLEQQLGWKSVYAYNNEDFEPGNVMGGGAARWLYE